MLLWGETKSESHSLAINTETQKSSHEVQKTKKGGYDYVFYSVQKSL